MNIKKSLACFSAAALCIGVPSSLLKADAAAGKTYYDETSSSIGKVEILGAGYAITGDLNNDKSISVADVVILQKFLVGKGSYNDIRNNGDINNDGKINIFDMIFLKEMILNPDPDDKIKDYGTPMNESAATIADFRKGTTPLFFASDGWTNGNPFDCGWTEKNAVVDNGYLSLSIDKDTSGKYNYSGGEYRTADHYGYGYYETSMQAIKNPGVVSSFFTYTGPTENNPWDEIDIEVLGKDTTKVQFNYYTNGVGNHEYMYDLGFDASEGFHTYGFDWQPDSITWYVDGKEVYKATTNIPSTPGRIMMNTWPGTGVDSWLAPYDGKTPLTARYQWVTYNKNR